MGHKDLKASRDFPVERKGSKDLKVIRAMSVSVNRVRRATSETMVLRVLRGRRKQAFRGHKEIKVL